MSPTEADTAQEPPRAVDHGIDYEGLGISRRQIRLLHLTTPPPDDGPIECTLEAYDRTTCPEYVALSYTWGSEPNTCELAINGKTCLVSPTVHEAVREICRQGAAAFLWIDQICINQKDMDEKNHQVMAMRHIYSNADAAIAWLGPAFEDCEALFRHMRRLGNCVQKKDWDGLALLHDDEAHLQKMQKAYDLLCSRSYWQRLWILQEFALAYHVTVMCGSVSLPYDLLLAVQQAEGSLEDELSTRYAESRQQLLESMQGSYGSASRSYLDSVVTRRQRFRTDGYKGDRFFQVLAVCLTLENDYNMVQASDPRDRVFSLLYLAADVEDLKELLDYTKTCRQAYYDTALALMKQGDVDVLSYCQFPRVTEGLPTWAPDWCMAVRNPCNQAPWASKFCASGDNSFKKQKLEEVGPGRLSIRGLAVDAVDKIGQVWDPDWKVPLDRKAALAFIDDIKELCLLSPRTRAYEELIDAVRIASCDGAQYGQEDLSGAKIGNYIGEFIWAYDRLLSLGNRVDDEGEPLEDLEPSDNDWLVCAMHYLHSRRPFLTKTGYIGLGPSHMEEGDEVCIFYGGKMPYVVRKDAEGEDYSLVGEAFVYGLMYGEIFRGKVQAKTYVLR